MHTQSYRQLNIRGAAGAGDEDEVVAIFGFVEDLVHIRAEHGGLDNGKVDAWGSVAEACSACIKITGSAQPAPSDVGAYRNSYAVYRDLYPALKSSFEKM